MTGGLWPHLEPGVKPPPDAGSLTPCAAEYSALDPLIAEIRRALGSSGVLGRDFVPRWNAALQDEAGSTAHRHSLAARQLGAALREAALSLDLIDIAGGWGWNKAHLIAELLLLEAPTSARYAFWRAAGPQVRQRIRHATTAHVQRCFSTEEDPGARPRLWPDLGRQADLGLRHFGLRKPICGPNGPRLTLNLTQPSGRQAERRAGRALARLRAAPVTPFDLSQDWMSLYEALRRHLTDPDLPGDTPAAQAWDDLALVLSSAGLPSADLTPLINGDEP